VERMYSRELIDDILKQADIVSIISSYITVTKKGRSFVALCPFHDDKHPSLNISKEKQIFKCFSCGAGGNAITFVEKYEKISFEEAVRKVADLIGYHDPRLRQEAYRPHVDSSLMPLHSCIDDLEKYYQYGLTIQEGAKAVDYLASRHISSDQISKYGLGYSPIDGKKTIEYLKAKNHSLKTIEDIGISLARSEGMSDSNAGRLIFPLTDPNGQVVGFSARRLADDGSTKYVNSPETKIFQKGKLIYNYHNAKQTARHDGYIYVLEGFMDVMALDKAGIPSAVALMGTNLSGNQIEMLRRLNCEVRVCLDGDAPGQEAMMKITSQLNRAGINFRLVSNPGDLRDPDDILQEAGPEALKESMNRLVDAFDFQVNYYTNVKKLDTPEDKKKVMMYFIPYLRNMPAGLDRDNYLVKLSNATGYEIKAIREQINQSSPAETSAEEATYADEIDFERLHPEKRLYKRLMMAEREILYYMMESQDAVKYFETTVDSFYTPIYNDIANYIVDYIDKRKVPVDVSGLLADIAESADNADELASSVTQIAGERDHPPFSQKALQDCAIAIRQEKDRLHDMDTTEKAIQGKSEHEKAMLITDYTKRRHERLKSRSKKKDDEGH
jgi:DNA primase